MIRELKEMGIELMVSIWRQWIEPAKIMRKCWRRGI